mmetsp:Transcript_17168/g.33656  ORF Transcript_17168/g.33656 Transcript_17168/m.33656 type:complete len:321 (+) Transcript_17168:219-1181(+)|eukprot:CAMPEP_0171484618 /NCGR_PEP_ID=MMETSP0958-20121227/100_1 /TAXON_ID=87120 /ORGANISM="Aurantiochytrium limacinum, Strain ATCCMYA-1381" /LENGTH=320 /DNA_ID=CAMNT_0012017337 /DNA_START=127 /DNA_END=1089 /DNA_ORIENTATION=-
MSAPEPRLDYEALKAARETGYNALDVTVYREDTDTLGIVFYRNYLTWFERGRESVISVQFLADLYAYNGNSFVVTRSDLLFKSPGRYGDDLEVRTIPFLDGPFRVHFDQSIWRKSDNTLLVAGFVEMVVVSKTFQLVKAPSFVVELMGFFDECKKNFSFLDKPGTKKRPPMRKKPAPRDAVAEASAKVANFDYHIHMADTDFTGIAFHPNYYFWFERARTQYLSPEVLLEAKNQEQAVPVVRRAKVTYKYGARPYEDLRIVTKRNRKADPSEYVVSISQSLIRVADNQVLIESEFEIVFLHDTKRNLVKIPQVVNAAIGP